MTARGMAPLKLTFLFLLAGCAWVSFSDLLIARFVRDPAIATRISIIKGWFFVLVSAGCLYWLVRRFTLALRQSEQALIKRNTELTTIEETLRVSHQQFVALVDSIEGIVWECETSAFSFTFVSQKAERMLGYPVSQWLGEPTFWRDHLHPDDRDRAFQALVTAARDRNDHCVEYRFLAPTGNAVWVRNNITVIIEENGSVALRGVMYDITPQKTVEEEINKLNFELEKRVMERTAQLESANQELQAIFQALPDLFFRIDTDGTILDYKAGSRIDYFEPRREVIGRNVQEILPPRAFEQFEEDLRVLSTASGLSSFEYVRPGHDGERYYEARLLPFRDRQVIALIRNITERKRAEQEIRVLNEDLQRRACQLEVINQELESFSYSVSHDLRTPLRHIDGFSRALQEDCSHLLDADGKMYVQRVRHAAQRMGQLIDDMLKLANVTSSQLVRQRINMGAMARTIAAELRQSQPERGVTFNIEENITAHGDPRLLRVVLANLIGNAWKYTGQKMDGLIEFGALTDDGELTYYVRDNGAGFDMAYAGKLFTAFQRLHRMEEFEGNGIGLATVQRVIRRHGGRVWGEGVLGEGAAFYFTLGENEFAEAGGAWDKN